MAAEVWPEKGALNSEANIRRSPNNGKAIDVAGSPPPKIEIVWKNVILMGSLHIGAAYGLFLILTWRVKLLTLAFGMCFQKDFQLVSCPESMANHVC